MACLFALTGILLAYTWNMIYIELIYSEPFIFHGTGEVENPENYSKQTKSDYVVQQSFFTLLMLGLFIYYFFCCKTWAELGDGPAHNDNPQKQMDTPVEPAEEKPAMDDGPAME